MRYYNYLISFLAHPIWFPIYGAMIVLFHIPIFLTISEIRFTWLLLLLITVALPTMVYLILFVFNWLENPFLIPDEKQKWLLYGYIVILLSVAFWITPFEKFPFIHFYIIGLTVGCITILFFLFFKIRSNMSAMGMGALTTFTLLMSILFQKDMTYIIAFLLFLSGADITVQIYLTHQRIRMVLLSYLMGALPQLFLPILFRNLTLAYH